MKKVFWAICLALSVGVGVAYWFDLTGWTDGVTGFVLRWPLWARYAAVALPAAAVMGLGGGFSAGPAPARRRLGMAFACLLACGLLLFSNVITAIGLLGLGSADKVAATPAAVAACVLGLLAGLWFFSLYMFFMFPREKGAVGGLLLALPGCAHFFYQVIATFSKGLPSLARPAVIFTLLSVLAQLGLATCLARTAYLPEAVSPGWNFRGGLLAFLGAFCLPLPGFVNSVLAAGGRPTAQAIGLLPALAVGLVGLALSYSYGTQPPVPAYADGPRRADLPPAPSFTAPSALAGLSQKNAASAPLPSAVEIEVPRTAPVAPAPAKPEQARAILDTLPKPPSSPEAPPAPRAGSLPDTLPRAADGRVIFRAPKK